VFRGDVSEIGAGWKVQLASDIHRDGMGLELLDSGVVVAEIFRCDRSKTIIVTTFKNDIPLEIFERYYRTAWARLDMGFAWHRLHLACVRLRMGRLGVGSSKPPLRVVGGLMVASGVIGLAWPFAPMHLRGAELTLTDTMHIVLAIVTVLLMLLAMCFGAAAFGKRFRLYSIATMVILVAFGALTGLDGPRIAANLPTPWVGLWERINISVFLLWVVVLALALLRTQVERPRDGLGGGRDSG
jgi:hypothetical protein